MQVAEIIDVFAELDLGAAVVVLLHKERVMLPDLASNLPWYGFHLLCKLHKARPYPYPSINSEKIKQRKNKHET